MENIRYGRLTATDEECMAAAARECGYLHQASARRLQHDADRRRHESEPGPAPAAGDCPQRSRIRRVLILDEASSIDTRTEKLVQDGMDGLMCGRTTFVIAAHRLYPPCATRTASWCWSRAVSSSAHPRRADCPEGPLLPPAPLHSPRTAKNVEKRSQNGIKSIKTAWIGIRRPGGFCKNAATAPKVDGKGKIGYNRMRRHAKSAADHAGQRKQAALHNIQDMPIGGNKYGTQEEKLHRPYLPRVSSKPSVPALTAKSI